TPAATSSRVRYSFQHIDQGFGVVCAGVGVMGKMTSTGVVLGWLVRREKRHPHRSGRVRHRAMPPNSPQISRSQPVHLTLPRPWFITGVKSGEFDREAL
ncbi:hypothetical protein LR393_34645, partial [Kineosporia mesophila]|uniref:hypothetical protein n=1 Tax=Kineosporia mesophila TaxID=566012 RepID=UPI001E3D50F9